MGNIIITSAGQRVVLTEIFKDSAKELGLASKVYTTDMNPKYAPAGYVSDGCFPVCRCTDSNYASQLLEICLKNEVQIVVPTIDTELQVLSVNKPLFRNKGIQIIVSDSCFIDSCRDKRKTSSFFNSLDINVPKQIDLNHPSFPIFAKPYDGSLSTNLHVIRSEKDLTEEILGDSKLIFMEYIDKTDYVEYTVDMYYGRDNYVKSIVPRERIKVRAGEINKGITRKNYLVGFLKERMNHLEGVEGCICVQLFYRESDHSVLGIEINPRFGGGYPLSYHSHANFPLYILKEYLLDQEIQYSDAWLDKTLMLRYDREIIIYEQ